MSFKLKPLHTERGFWAATLTGLPGLVVAYCLAARLAVDLAGSNVVDAAASLESVGIITAAIVANPITAYLAARQYARGKAVEAASRKPATNWIVAQGSPNSPADAA